MRHNSNCLTNNNLIMNSNNCNCVSKNKISVLLHSKPEKFDIKELLSSKILPSLATIKSLISQSNLFS